MNIIVSDKRSKCYTNFGNIDKNTEMEIRKNVIRYNDKHGSRYVVRWSDDEPYLKENGYASTHDVYGDMVNDYNSHLAAEETPMQY